MTPAKNQAEAERLIESGESEPVQIQLVPVPTTEIDEKDIMANLNKVVIVGHLVRDPEKRVGPSGNPFGLFTIAANYRYTDKNGQRQEEAAFVPCLVFGAAVEWLLEKRKGALTIVSGRLRTESWEQDGTRMSRLILVCETAQFAQKADGNGTPVATASGRNGNCAVESDIPF
jgi:single-strand DNA-binding protein